MAVASIIQRPRRVIGEVRDVTKGTFRVGKEGYHLGKGFLRFAGATAVLAVAALPAVGELVNVVSRSRHMGDVLPGWASSVGAHTEPLLDGSRLLKPIGAAGEVESGLLHLTNAVNQLGSAASHIVSAPIAAGVEAVSDASGTEPGIHSAVDTGAEALVGGGLLLGSAKYWVQHALPHGKR